MGSRSLAPRGIIRCISVRGCGSSIEEGMGGISGGGPTLEVGREAILEFRRSRFVVENEVGGAVWGVRGVYGVMGMGGELTDFPLTRESHFLVEGEMAILARESFCDMDRRRLWGEDLMMGEAEDTVDVS